MARGAALFIGIFAALSAIAAPLAASAQQSQPPAVGVVAAARKPITQSSEYIGRIQAKDRVNIVARVAAFLDKVYFTEGAEVKSGDPLYRLEQGPFQADVQAKQASVAQFKAQLQNATVAYGRAKALLSTPAGQQSAVDLALANQQSLQAQVQNAEAQLQVSQINLGYTDIRAPIDGKIGRTAVTQGNYVSPGSGTLATIVSQDPMYVTFPVSARVVLDLRQRYADKGGFGAAVVKVRLPDGRIYNQTGAIDFVDNTIAGNTDTITLRGTIANPVLASGAGRELVDGELVTVILEDATPVEAIAVPRAAILSDQRGDYLYVVGADDKAEQRRVKLGQSSPTLAVVTSGLSEGENVIVEGVQRARPGEKVAPGPASPAASAVSGAAPASQGAPAAAPAAPRG
ncbi:MAG TPA: efflux RND transporter periplasmic adaptor subunit [Stellaceae bacterium]|nr:efflux RND transporter periplasmic adaptor subunit [Stellaceae bacterium]